MMQCSMQYVNLTTQERAYKASFFYYVDAFRTYGGPMNNNVCWSPGLACLR